MGVDDWVQAHGAFWFVRVRNRSTQPITLSDGTIENCANVGAGCGAIERHITVAPDSTATLAAVAGRSAETPPTFTYRYQAHLGGYAYAGSGTSHKSPPLGAAPISSRELSQAEAPLLAELHPAAPPAPQAAPAAPPPAAATHPAPPPEVVTPEPTVEPTAVETPELRPVEPTPEPTPARVYRRLTRLQAQPTPTPTPEPPRPHSFQHLLTRGLQHWLIH
jgi:hypothetical protein